MRGWNHNSNGNLLKVKRSLNYRPFKYIYNSCLSILVDTPSTFAPIDLSTYLQFT